MPKHAEVTPVEPLDGDERLDKFRSDLTKDAGVVDEQRDKANEDMRFVHVDGGMWEGFFENDSEDRARLEFDIVSDYIQRFIGEWNQNRIGVEYKPADSATTDDDAELLNGIYRADFNHNSGKLATDNAVDEMSTCGYGAMKLSTVFEDEEDPENDNMRVEWRPIYNAYNTAIWDQAAQRIDKKDARHVTVLKEYTIDSFNAVWPDEDPTSAYQPENRAFENWSNRAVELIYIATRYEIVRKRENVYVYNNFQSDEVETYTEEEHKLIEGELKSSAFRKFVRKRRIIRQSVEKTVFSGSAILEDTRRVTGKFLPVVPFYGYRAYVDGVEWYRGLVRKLKDAARLFNMQMSQLAENSASSGQQIPIFDPDQMEGDAIPELWANRNNKPYLLARALRDNDGKIVAHGPSGYVQPGQLDGSTAALMQLVPEYVRGVTGAVPQDTLDPDASGKAIQAMIKRENLNTQVLTDNIGNAIRASGEIYQSMAAEVYSNQRMLRTVSREGKETNTQLMKTVMDETTGKLTDTNNLNGKRFRAYSDVGPQYETLREQTVEDIKDMVPMVAAVPGGEQFVGPLLSVLMSNMNGVGMESIKELNRKDMLAKGIVKPENDEEEAFVAQIQENPQEDPQRKLVEAATQQQEAEARNLDSDTVSKIATSKKTEAQTVEIMEGIGMDKAKLLLEANKENIQQARTGL